MQIVIQALALIIAGKGAWPALLQSRFLSFGALLFYALVGAVILSFVWMVRSNGASQPRPIPSGRMSGPQIQSADYGSDQRRVDVTRRVRAMVMDRQYLLPDGRIGLPVNNEIVTGAHDPHYGVYKYLKVTLSQTADEGKVLILPYLG